MLFLAVVPSALSGGGTESDSVFGYLVFGYRVLFLAAARSLTVCSGT